ncbi:hypothetical protein WN944_009935 [Citrus x changshan-huyou]|uniref:Uncharacterized protein n=1 Tax=Citrus x changshan-huyou TaxID=2935761 RepID=A0AAP0MTZ8_9ROSI
MCIRKCYRCFWELCSQFDHSLFKLSVELYSHVIFRFYATMFIKKDLFLDYDCGGGNSMASNRYALCCVSKVRSLLDDIYSESSDPKPGKSIMGPPSRALSAAFAAGNSVNAGDELPVSELE